MRPQVEAMWTVLLARWDQLRRRPEDGYSTEAVLVTALLVVAAIAVIAIIVGKVTEKATGITM
ncbi:hypothetical protein V5P93_002335 [Actinokineospora auranticolor]|uniref:Flagellin-like protein n=1 Tax=Actinokineospora auranticolor TaxID=155976 RepID=A0A2S6GE58_9PSEU|nr:hypothetical protein [Actinokineospora auranticolor]PPK63366.1 hypothetical protein CLV40_12979 [Actinokineospora auranticolor]